MKFSFLSLQFKRWPLEYAFQMATEYGFDGLELWGARPHAYPFDIDLTAVSEILNWQKKYGICVPMYTPELLSYPYNLASSSPKEQEETVVYLKRAVDVCEAIQCPAMLVSCDHPGYGRNQHECWRLLTEGLKEVASYALHHGIQLRMESLGPNTSPIVSRSEDLARLIADVDMPNFGAMLDMAIPPLCAEPYAQYFEQIPGGIDYVHLCGCDGIFETHLQVTEGTIDFAAMFRVLSRHGYDGWCSLEILEPYYRDPELYLAQAAQFLKSL